MFALIRTQALRTAGRRFASSTSQFPARKTFKKAFLSDPSTYPLIVIMGSALSFMTVMTVNALTNYKDIQINPSKRHDIIKTWEDKERRTMVDRLTKHGHSHALEWTRKMAREEGHD